MYDIISTITQGINHNNKNNTFIPFPKCKCKILKTFVGTYKLYGSILEPIKTYFI